MIELCRRQLDFGDGLIAEEVGDLWEGWMRHVDKLLEDPLLVKAVYDALAARWTNSRTRGRKGTPVEVVLRLLVLKHMRNWSYAVLEREVRSNLVYRQFTRVGSAKVPDAKTLGKLGIALGPEVAPGKIVSLFEPHTEIIRKGKAGKPTEFGKMVKIQEAEEQIVTHYEVYDQRPGDSDLLIPALEVHEQQFGHVPRLVTADAGFFSARNEAVAHERGVKRVAIPNLGTKSVERRVLQRKRWFRKAQKWRTGCEGRISVLKRRHGLERCRYKGPSGIKRWVGLGVIAGNLINIARVIDAPASR